MSTPNSFNGVRWCRGRDCGGLYPKVKATFESDIKMGPPDPHDSDFGMWFIFIRLEVRVYILVMLFRRDEITSRMSNRHNHFSCRVIGRPSSLFLRRRA